VNFQILFSASDVLAFSVLWPLIPLLALINNLFEARLDFFRLCKGCRRPVPNPTKGIGVYETHLKMANHASVVMTLGLCLVATHNMDVYFAFWKGTSYEEVLFYEDPDTHTMHLSIAVRFIIAVMVEHILIMLQSVIENLIPAEAEWVRELRIQSKSVMAKVIEDSVNASHYNERVANAKS
jgi:hypothetical protein